MPKLYYGTGSKPWALCHLSRYSPPVKAVFKESFLLIQTSQKQFPEKTQDLWFTGGSVLIAVRRLFRRPLLYPWYWEILSEETTRIISTAFLSSRLSGRQYQAEMLHSSEVHSCPGFGRWSNSWKIFLSNTKMVLEKELRKIVSN